MTLPLFQGFSLRLGAHTDNGALYAWLIMAYGLESILVGSSLRFGESGKVIKVEGVHLGLAFGWR